MPLRCYSMEAQALLDLHAVAVAGHGARDAMQSKPPFKMSAPWTEADDRKAREQILEIEARAARQQRVRRRKASILRAAERKAEAEKLVDGVASKVRKTMRFVLHCVHHFYIISPSLPPRALTRHSDNDLTSHNTGCALTIPGPALMG